MKKFTALALSVVLFISLLSTPILNTNNFTVKADTTSWPAAPGIYGTCGVLIDAETGTVLYEKKAHKKMYPASITKILTALVTLQNSSLDEKVTFSSEAVNSLEYGDANMAMQVGEIMTVEECLYGLMLASANEVATALAEHVGGSVEKFANMMNDCAKASGATDSHFTNANGLHNADHYLTAYDMGMITRAAVSNPVFLSITGSTTYTIGKTNKKKAQTVYQRHKMLWPTSGYYYEGTLGGKTGYTDQAGTTLVTYAKRDGMTLICVVLQSNGTNVYKDTEALFDYGFNNFHLVNVADNDSRFTEKLGYADTLTSIFGDSCSNTLFISSQNNIVLPKKAEFSDVSSEVDFAADNNSIESEVGGITYTYSNHNVGRVPIVLDNPLNYEPTEDIANAVAADTSTSIRNKNNTSSVSDKTNTSETTATIDKKSIDKKSKADTSFKKSIIKNVIIVLILLSLLVIIVIAIRNHQKKLNEIRTMKRRRHY